MKCINHWMAAALAVLLVAGLALAAPQAPSGTVVGKNGWTATEAFRTTDLANALSEWSGLSDLTLLPAYAAATSQGLTENSAGDICFIPNGRLADPERVLSGVVSWDGSGFTTIMQVEALVVTSPSTNIKSGEGDYIIGILAVPETVPGLSKDDLLMVRMVMDDKTWDGSQWVGDDHLEVVRLPADAGSPGGVDAASEVILYTYDVEYTPRAAIAVDESGDLYLSGYGLSVSGVSLNSTIRKLTYSSSSGSYSDAELYWNSALISGVKQLTPFVYGVVGSNILEIDPSTGDDSGFSAFDSSVSLQSWTFDVDGYLWLSLRVVGSAGYVALAPQGGTATQSSRIAEFATHASPCLTTRTAGGLYIASEVFTVTSTGGNRYYYAETHEAVFSLTPPAAGGGGGGGGGHGKNK